jgi:cytosine/adenosine deaminase-related metal-dependent hydrolase
MPEDQLSRRGFLTASAGTLLAASATGQTPAIAQTTVGPLLVEAGAALIWDKGETRLARDVTLLIEEDRIAAVNPKRLPAAARRLRLPDYLVLPGFISGHTHVATGTPTRGLIESGRAYTRPIQLAAALSDEELDALTAFNLAELLLSGCTTQVEMSLTLRQAESYVRVASDWGARGYVGAMIPNTTRLAPIWYRDDDQALFDSEPDTLLEIAENLAFGERHNNASADRIRTMMSPHACDTQTEATMAALGAAAKRLGNGVHIHLSQSAGETETVKRLWGMTPTQWCEKHDFFAGPFFGAHMIGLDWEIDPPILKRHGAVFAHCPSAGGAGGYSMPYPEALAQDMAVNIGIDTHSNDYLENLKLAVLIGQARYYLRKDGQPPVRLPTIADAVAGATHVPATGLGRDDLGRLARGAKADWIAINVSNFLTGAGALPPEPLNNLLYASGPAVRYVMTDGVMQVANGALRVADAQKVLTDGGAVVKKIWSQLEAEGWFDQQGQG